MTTSTDTTRAKTRPMEGRRRRVPFRVSVVGLPYAPRTVSALGATAGVSPPKYESDEMVQNATHFEDIPTWTPGLSGRREALASGAGPVDGP